jgi:hypothetical protein
MSKSIKFNRRELGTVLAALRLWQSTPGRKHLWQWDIATDVGELKPLDNEEIDELCERINV